MTEKKPTTCERDGHRHIEIEDRGRPGQVFLCERCGAVHRAKYSESGGVTMTLIGWATYLDDTKRTDQPGGES